MSDVKEYEMPSSEGYNPDYRRRGPGPRTLKGSRDRSQKRRKQAGVVFLVTAGFALLGLIAALLSGIEFADRTKPGKSTTQPVMTQESWIVMGTVEADTSGSASWISVMSWDKKKAQAFMMYLPKTTLAEVPGIGQETLDQTLSLGKEPLLISGVENLLGIQFDHYMKISDQGIRALFDSAGGLTLDVDQKLTRKQDDGKIYTTFSEGRQHLDGKRVAEFMSYTDESGDEISRANRHATIWSALFDGFGDKPSDLASKVASVKDVFVTDAKPKDIEDLFRAFASARDGQTFMQTLPVTSTGVASGIQHYAPDREAIDKIVQQYLANSRPSGSGRTGRRVEILNGNGKPGLGQEVAEKLVPQGFRIILSQNAKSLEYEKTQVVIYSDSKAALDIAKQVKALLGVGEILISRQQQSVVDVTIVVGKDYLEKHKQ